MNNFEVIDYRFAKVTDVHDEIFIQENAWSRLYEYKYVIDFIKEQNIYEPKLHNSSWGFEGIHVIFRDELDKLGECLHSDIAHSIYRDTHYYDITEENKEFEKKFDFVLNISTIEHLETSTDRIKSIENLFKQVKVGGFLVLTFDYPRVNLEEINALVKFNCELPSNPLNGENSINPNKIYKDLNIVYLILKKHE